MTDQDVIFDQDDVSAESGSKSEQENTEEEEVRENSSSRNQGVGGLRPFASNGDEDGEAAWLEKDSNGDFYISLKSGENIFPQERYKREFNVFAKSVRKDLERIRENQG